jgi:hypothetical protein
MATPRWHGVDRPGDEDVGTPHGIVDRIRARPSSTDVADRYT